MLGRFILSLIKIAVGSLIVGSILAHFGITTDQLLREVGLTPEKVIELTRQAIDWAIPNLILGSIVIVPLWFVIFLFQPPRARD